MRDLIKWFLPLFAVALVASSCGSFKKMAKGVDKIGFTTSPEVLTLCGCNKVAVDLSVNFPPLYFEKSAVVQVTPVLSYEGGEIVFDPFTVQGSAVVDNSKSVNFAAGGVVTEDLVFDYKPEMSRSTLKVRVAVWDGAKFLPVNPKTGAVIPQEQMKIVINEPKSAAAKSALNECNIDVAAGVATLVKMVDYKRLMKVVDDAVVEKVANQTIFEKGYTASLISEEDHVAARELNNEGVELAKSNKFDDAIAKFEAAKAKGVYTEISNGNLMFAYLAKGDKRSAMDVYDIVCPAQRGAVAILNMDYEAAAELIKEAQTLAILKLILDDANAALKVLGDDQSPRANYIRAMAHAVKGNKAEAKKALEKAVTVKYLKEQAAKNAILVLVM